MLVHYTPTLMHLRTRKAAMQLTIPLKSTEPEMCQNMHKLGADMSPQRHLVVVPAVPREASRPHMLVSSCRPFANQQSPGWVGHALWLPRCLAPCSVISYKPLPQCSYNDGLAGISQHTRASMHHVSLCLQDLWQLCWRHSRPQYGKAGKCYVALTSFKITSQSCQGQGHLDHMAEGLSSDNMHKTERSTVDENVLQWVNYCTICCVHLSSCNEHASSVSLIARQDHITCTVHGSSKAFPGASQRTKC